MERKSESSYHDISIPKNESGKGSGFEEVGRGEAEMRRVFGEYIENIYNQLVSFNPGRKAFENKTEMYIAKVSGEEEKVSKGLLPKNYCRATALFLEEMVNFIKLKRNSKDEDERIRLKEFIVEVNDGLFSWSPNISNHTGIDELFSLGSMATRVPEVQGWFGSNMVGKLVYELAYGGDKVVELIFKKWENKPVSEVLDAVDFLQSVGAHSIANGEWAEAALEKVAGLLQKLSDAYPCALVGYAISNAEQRIDSEWDDPSVSIFQFRGDRANSRLSEDLDRKLVGESLRLRSCISSDVKLSQGGKILRVASDAIAILDHSNTARYYGYNQRKESEGEMDNTARTYNLALTFSSYQIEQLVGYDNFEATLDIILENLQRENPDIAPSDTERMATALFNVSDFFSEKEWKTIIDYLFTPKNSSKLKLTLQKLFTRIDQSGLKLFQDIKRKVLSWAEEIEERKTPVSFHEYDDLPKDQGVNPFGGDGTELPLLMQHLHNPAMRVGIEKDLGISLRDLPLRAQIRLLEFLADPQGGNFSRLQKVLQDSPESRYDIVVSFLSCAEDKKFGEIILDLLEKLSSEAIKNIFSKYGDIVKMTDDLRGYVKDNFGDKVQESDLLKITQAVLHRGNVLLESFAQYSEAELESNEKQKEIIDRLEKVEADAVIFGATFKTLFKENPSIDIKEMRGLDLQRTPQAWLSDRDKSEMVEIAKKNWLSRDGGKEVVEKFESVLNGASKIDFYILRRDGKIISFMRFDEADSEGKRHVASFNVDSKYSGSAIGEMMVRNVLVAETEKSVVEASVFPFQEKAPEYVEEIGFNITGVSHDKKTGLSELVLECDRRKNAQFASRGSSKETLMSLATSDGARNWRELIGHNVIVLKFNPTKERAILVGAVDGLVEAGYVGTRHFFAPKNKDERYYVFELDKTKQKTEGMPREERRKAVNE
ncbi:MAG TPA: hypothetical protein PLV72_03985 [Candidatus Magasanikbacteria bacterium]|nr:hypothetical protein [Candidatus Magasanikbacteria bacterium]